jgi:hypothetical protein
MQQDLIGYDDIIQNSMRSIIFETFKKIEKTGLPGKHYFILTFLTTFGGVSVSKGLKEKYPEEVTIVIQYQYKNLEVQKDLFKISLSFGGRFEKLVVPYKSITSFADPFMNFGLKFVVTSIENVDSEHGFEKNPSNDKNVDLSAKIISLDAFRKNKNNK